MHIQFYNIDGTVTILGLQTFTKNFEFVIFLLLRVPEIKVIKGITGIKATSEGLTNNKISVTNKYTSTTSTRITMQ